MKTRRVMARDGRGFSLVELMVAMTLSLILLAGALSILYSSKLTYTENDRIARLQEAGRTVVELILRDARAAGYVGCARPLVAGDFVNGLNGAGTLLWNYGEPVQGYEAAGANWAPALDTANIPNAEPGSDVIVLRTSRQGQPVFRTTLPVTNPTDPVSVEGASGVTIANGTPLIISDCRGSSAFVATSFTPVTPTTATIQHSAGAGTPANSTASLTRAFEIGARVMPIQTVIYYVSQDCDGAGGEPAGFALCQKIGAGASRRLVPGIERMQVLYGIGPNMQATQYVKADAVANWNSVVSMSVAILVRSEDEGGVERDSRTYTLLDEVNYDPADDRRQRSVFTTTVVLRNRAG